MQLYDEETTIEHVKSLAFNRTASSTGETEAVNYMEKELKESDIDSKVEHFEWNGPMKILMRMIYILLLIYLFLFRAFLIIIVYFILKNMFERTRKISFVQKEESKNLYALIPGKENIPNKPLVIISAHYDSVSANLPYKLQVLVFFLYRIIVIFYAVIILLFTVVFFLDYFSIIPFTTFSVILITTTSIGGVFVSIPIVYLVFVERPSSGSIDNASGVAISLELARLIKKDPLEKMDLLFLWTGAEEWGLKGSKKFCRQHFKMLKQKYDFDRSFNINIDMIGTYIGLLNKSGFILKRKLNKNLNDVLEATAKHLNISIVKYNKTIKPQSDYKVFRKYARKLGTKFQVSCFHSSKDSKYIHSVRDSPDKCSVDNLNGCLNICHQALRSIDLRITSN
ncbi:MAG: M28 family peptidase [Promethearchaeota archaeon]|nr:MAG: M28 family peptidase [Candidatus Lokiarchaeota archaeon]